MIKFIGGMLTLKKKKVIVVAPSTNKIFIGKLNKAYLCDAFIFQNRLSKLIKKEKT